jgi:lipopolysaccharide/colanic/teichoic acid biosynthesis glycosyltransferase
MERYSVWPGAGYATKLVRNKDSSLQFYSKRILDVVLAILSLIVLIPLLLLIGILIKLDSSGPVFFVQERIGARRRLYQGKTIWEICKFSCYKYRTMYTDIDEDLHRDFMEAYISGDEAKMAELQPDQEAATSFKLTGDPRVTRMGKFLRQTSLDELPQLWNVLKGEMSLVGPRPPIPYEVEMYEPKDIRRLAAMPGITGLWQVSGRCDISFEEMVRLDVKYIEKQSLWLDIKILLLTLPAVLSKKGAE